MSGLKRWIWSLAVLGLVAFLAQRVPAAEEGPGMLIRVSEQAGLERQGELVAVDVTGREAATLESTVTGLEFGLRDFRDCAAVFVELVRPEGLKDAF
jgi:hypothetical protein